MLRFMLQQPAAHMVHFMTEARFAGSYTSGSRLTTFTCVVVLLLPPEEGVTSFCLTLVTSYFRSLNA